MINKVVVTDAFFIHKQQTLLNPALVSYEQSLLSMQQRCHPSVNMTPLAWLAHNMGVNPASLLGSCREEGLGKYQQYWVVSPYHARLTRSTLRVMPDAMLDISVQQAEQICEVLNPLLVDDGLLLQTIGAALLLSSERVWDVLPTSFADVSGAVLPDRLPEGKDAGSWMRLMSEIQMLLHQNPVLTHNGLEVHGLWFWGKSEHLETINVQQIPCVATRNITLQALLQHHDKVQNAKVIVTEAERLPLLLQPSQKQAKHWVLMGAGKMITLQNSVIVAAMAKLKTPKWKGM